MKTIIASSQKLLDGEFANDKDITIEIYNNRTNELLSKRSYNLIPENRFSDRRFRIELHYFDRAGKEQICDGEQLSKLNINYKMPMKVVVKDWWDRTHWIESCNVKFIGTGGETIVFPCNSPQRVVNPLYYNTLTPKAMEKIKSLRANEKFFITDVVLGCSPIICIRRELAPIEITK